MEIITPSIFNQTDISIGRSNISNILIPSSIDNSSTDLKHDSTTDSGQRSKFNSPDVTSRSFLNSMCSSMQSWQSGQSVNTWMPQSL